MDIAANIVAIRKSKHFNQSQLARTAGVSLTALRHYENGERVPNVAIATKLADALGVSVQELLLIDGAQVEPPTQTDGDGDLAEIIKLLTELDSQQLKLLLLFLKALTQDS